MTLENQDFLERKGHEGPQEHLATLGTQGFPVFLAKMVPQAPQASPDVMERREREGRSGRRAYLDSAAIPDHQGYQE